MPNEPKLPVVGGMQVRTYAVLTRAVEEGISHGWRRAHKHAESPSPEVIQEAICTAVLGEICDVFRFTDEES
jgi:hypothetical protein